MKKTIVILGTILVVVLGLKFGLDFALDNYWKTNYGGTSYYAKITSKTPYSKHKYDDGNGSYYEYNVEGIDDKGKQKEITFNESMDRPLKINAYLKLVVNNKKGVTEWRSVKYSDMPRKVQSEINK
jgi:uncharacterized protein (TIGR01655 family)